LQSSVKMRNGVSIYKLLTVCLAVVMIAGCSFIKREPPLEQTPATPAPASKAAHDPLSLPQDTIVITQADLKSSALADHAAVPIDAGVASGVSRISGESPLGAESANSQVYRVQLLTFNAYGEGRRALTVAEEMFDQPVSLDYDVPYYKLRVGQFAAREGAERYLQRARTAGYSNALVVISIIGIKDAAPLYESSGTHQRVPQKPADTAHADHN
jgi:hypothetical protein